MLFWGHTICPTISSASIGLHRNRKNVDTFLRSYIYRKYSIIVELFNRANAILEHILEHINDPLLGLFWRTEKFRTEEIEGGAFSIRPYIS